MNGNKFIVPPPLYDVYNVVDHWNLNGNVHVQGKIECYTKVKRRDRQVEGKYPYQGGFLSQNNGNFFFSK